MEETAEKKFNSIKNFIEHGQIITEVTRDNYMIYSPRFKMITVFNISRRKYIDYWTSITIGTRDEKYIKLTEELCNNKLDNDLISIEEMIELVKQSEDREKDEALKILRRSKNKTKNARLVNILSNIK